VETHFFLPKWLMTARLYWKRKVQIVIRNWQLKPWICVWKP